MKEKITISAAHKISAEDNLLTGIERSFCFLVMKIIAQMNNRKKVRKNCLGINTGSINDSL
jgi:hypothetical protein